ncbi:MAG: valine--tRNA ligase, partial [Calditrichaeota bacterium]
MADSTIAKVYDPSTVEDRLYRFWIEKKYFHAEPREDKKPYCIVIPPPNVTDRLHMGHAYNNTLQDILIRFKKMQGYETLWIPGTDHAGIATQNVVEKYLLRTENKTRHDLGREAFVKRVWEWKDKHGQIIIDQLKKMGCACDWDRERFTMDEGLSRAVAEVFVRLYKKGLIYRGKYIINWCPRCQTALSDEEVDRPEHQGHLWYIKS